jgi:HSP20 family protein
VLRADAPGFEPDEFDVQISGNQLILKAEHKEEQVEGETRGYRYGRLYRTVPLPAGVVEDKIAATYRNGVLELHLPKGEQAKGRRIDVKGAEGQATS